MHNRSNVSPVTSVLSIPGKNKSVFTASLTNTPEQRIIEEALTRGNKILLSGARPGEVVRSVKRLQNTSIERWKERAKKFEKRHQLPLPSHLLHKKKANNKLI